MPSDQLFDPDLFTSPADKPKPPPAKRPPAKPKPIEGRWKDPWVVVSSTKGPYPHLHLIEADAKEGSIYTKCGLRGWPLHGDGVLGTLCPDCVRRSTDS